jgi:hypothetical protein
MLRGPDRDDAQWAFFSGKGQRHEFAYSTLGHSLSGSGVLFFLNAKKQALLLHHPFHPGFRRRHLPMLLQESMAESHRRPRRQLHRVRRTFRQTHQSVRRSQAFHQLSEHLIENFVHGQCLRARGDQQRQPAHLVVQLFASRALPLQNQDHHGDANRHQQQMVKCDAQQEQRVIQPLRPVHSVQRTDKESTGQ